MDIYIKIMKKIQLIALLSPVLPFRLKLLPKKLLKNNRIKRGYYYKN
jgi:hypothetical protein